MNFTREPIIETIITPREGFKLVIRNSKESGHEEYFVDSLEVVTFGHSCFYRSLERPKCFLLPIADYEVLEVRETRMVLKNTSIEKGIKIGGGREAQVKNREIPYEKEIESSPSTFLVDDTKEEPIVEPRLEKRRERRRFRKRRREDLPMDELNEEEAESHDIHFQEREGSLEQVSEWAADLADSDREVTEQVPLQSEAIAERLEKPEKPERRTGIPSLLPPPATLISETLSRYKDTPIFSGAFYEKAETPASLEQQPLIDESSITVKEHDEEFSEEDDAMEFIERANEESSDQSDDSELPF